MKKENLSIIRLTLLRTKLVVRLITGSVIWPNDLGFMNHEQQFSGAGRTR